jgi:hypothetical protein
VVPHLARDFLLARRVERLRLGPEPTGYDHFQVHAGYAYWTQRRGDDTGDFANEALLRRALKPGAPQEDVVPALQSRTREGGYQSPMRFAGGRVYYLARDALWSAPVEGGAFPTRHFEVGEQPDVTDLVVQPPCAYWTFKDEIRRGLLTGGRPHVLARVSDGVYHLATDGAYLYWPGAGGTIVRAGRPGHGKPLRAFHVAPPPAPPPPPPREVRVAAPSDPSVFGEPVYFQNGNPVPAGKYLVSYVDGCMRYSGSQGWTVNAYEGGGPSWWIVGETVLDRRMIPPGNVGFERGAGGFDRFEDCVSASKRAAPRVLVHRGGKLGYWLQDALYDDNVPGEKGRNPTWRLTPVEPGPEASAIAPAVRADAGAPPTEATCHYPYGSGILCEGNPELKNQREFYVLAAINNKLRHFPAFAKFVAGAGILCVRDCTTARRYMKLYNEYAAAHRGFDVREPLEMDELNPVINPR